MVHGQLHDVGDKFHVQTLRMIGHRFADGCPIVGIERIVVVVILLVQNVDHISEFLASVEWRVFGAFGQVPREVLNEPFQQAGRQVSIHVDERVSNHGDLRIDRLGSIRLAKFADPGEKSF